MLTIYTTFGKTYKVNEKGQIMRTDMRFTPSGTWVLLGIQHVKATNTFIPISELTPENIKSISLLYKNGNPKFTMVDKDNGTKRVWGTERIKDIWFE